MRRCMRSEKTKRSRGPQDAPHIVAPPTPAPPLLCRSDSFTAADTFSFVSREDTLSQATFSHFIADSAPDNLVGVVSPADFSPPPPRVLPPAFGEEWPQMVGTESDNLASR